ncbi:MAG: methyltransferase family protein [Candidatus Hodarchaeota archaeon]
MKIIAKKLIVYLILSVIYPTIVYILMVPAIFSNPIYMIYLLMAYTGSLADTLIRPVTEDRNESKKFLLLLLLMFFLAPFFLVMAYNENLLLIAPFVGWWDSNIVSYAGIVAYLVGTFIVITSRVQLGSFGTGRLVVQENHELFTGGVYKYIRNPMYTGGLISGVGCFLVFRSLITLLMVTIIYFLMFKGRILEEEKQLEEKFGEKYAEYCKRSWRLIPGVY